MSSQLTAQPDEQRTDCGSEVEKLVPDERVLEESVLLLKGFSGSGR